MHPAILIVFAPPCRMALMVSSRTILSVACARASESRARGTRNLIATDVSPTWGLMENSTAFSEFDRLLHVRLVQRFAAQVPEAVPQLVAA